MTRNLRSTSLRCMPTANFRPLRRAAALRATAFAARLSCGSLLASGLLLSPAGAQTSTEESVLPKVTVVSQKERPDDLPQARAGGLLGAGARLGLLGNQEVMDTPFSITSYTAKLIEDQQARTVADILNNDPSVRFTTSGAHAFENFRLRGFDVHSADLAVNGMYGLAPQGSSTLEFVERVEVLKGPSAMFTGMSPSGGIGGVINLVPKRAADEALSRVTLGYQTDSQFTAGVDLGRRFGETKAIGLRVNASYGDGETGLQDQHKKRHMLAAALDYRGTQLSASLDVYDTQQRFDGGAPVMYGFASTSLAKAPDPSVNFLRGAAGELNSQAVIARADYDFGRGASAFASVGARKHDYAGFINGTHAHNVKPNGDAQVRGVAQLGYDDSLSAELGGRLNFATAGVLHEVVLQATMLELEAGFLSNVTGMQASNIYTPITPKLPAMPTGPVPKSSDATLSSLALVDTMSFMKDAVRLTVGVRQQQVEQAGYNANGTRSANYDESALTPAFGLVLKPWGEGLSLYANYVQGLSQGGVVTDVNASNYGQVFKPFETEQVEAGLKWKTGDFLNTASLFQIDRPTMMSTGPATNPTYTDGAETRVQGFEWTASGEVTAKLRVFGGIAYSQSELTRTQGGLNQGNETFGVPRWQGNFGAQWDSPLPGLSLNARTIATSKQYLDNANTYQIPGWGQLDLGASYSMQPAGHKLVLRLNVDNVLDRHYFAGGFAEPRATLAAGRVVRTSASMDF